MKEEEFRALQPPSAYRGDELSMLETPKAFLKHMVWKFGSPRLRQLLRRSYLSRLVLTNRGSHEPEFAAMRLLLAAGDCIADVGANVGIYTKEFSSLAGQTGLVYSFEPVRDTYDILENVVRRLPLRNVRTFRAALGEKHSQREIIIPDNGDFTGYYWAHFASPGEGGGREIVDVLTLDELANSGVVPRLQFIKCDVEGSELEVFCGARELLRQQKPGLLVEVSRESSEKVFSLFRELGYCAFTYSAVLQATESYREGEFSNYFFFHPASPMWPRLAPLRSGASA